MKESKLLKIICYILIPIIVAVMILSFMSYYVQNYTNDINEKNYFATDRFVSRYMNILSHFANRLIYQNESYPTCYDGEIQIAYLPDYQSYETEIKDCYALIVYQNKAFTNVELTAETNTIAKIQQFISQNENAKKVNILAGNIEADSDVITNKAIKYFDDFENNYYKVEKQHSENKTTIELEVVEPDEMEEVYETPEIQETCEYFTTHIQDFNIYSSYKEELKEYPGDAFLKEFINTYGDLGINIYVVLPACTSILLIIGLYLIVSIGHTKGKPEIDLNDLDKIPYEIILLILLIGFGILGMGIAIPSEMLNLNEDMELFISILVMLYIVCYIICAVIFDTTVKRIKAKTLLKNTWFYKACRWFYHLCKKTMNQLKNVWHETTFSKDLVKKLGVVIVGYIIIAIFLIGIWDGFGILLALALAGYIFYQIVKRINCYTKIEKHLKEMYEGNNTAKLNPEEFTSEFQETVKYLNDISNGFQNAIQEGIKSERLKAELITNVSHDIKTPLTSIINYVDLLKKEEIENEKAKEYMEVLDNKSQRLKKLTEDLLEASKASSGNVKLNMEKINIAELIKQSIGEFEDKFQSKNLQIVTNIPEKEIYIHADNRYMYRIIENIFSNVSKYSMEHSRVYIDVLPKDQKVQIAVKNISKDVLNISEEELMQRFVRGDKSRTTERKRATESPFPKA